ncbi:MAG: Gfo/Idh/MocA family protein [Armatimonadota bacterium]
MIRQAYAEGNLRYGVIGCGIQGEKHVQVIDLIPNATLVAVADVNEDRARVVGLRHGAKHALTDWRELLAIDEIEAVSIALPDHLHREVTVAALEAGKHVLLEKPMATTVEDAEAMLAAQQASGRKLMINWSNRWMFAFARTKEQLDAGVLGDPLYVYARLNNTLYVPTQMLSWSANTQLPYWLICHRYDIARWYFGCEAKRVFAVARSVVLRERGIDTPDFYAAIVEFEGGQVGNFESCWILPESMPYLVDSKFQLICSKGYVNVDPTPPVHQVATEESYAHEGFLFGNVMGQPVGFVRSAIEHFVNCCLTDTEPLITGEDGLHITRALAAMVESAQSGMPVEL